jgi:lipoprotein NlpD
MHFSSSLCPLNPRLRIAVAMLGIVVLATGCASRRPAPVEERAALPAPAIAPPTAAPAAPIEPAPVPTYTVKRGDTLHQIALDNGLDYRELAGWNNIENVNVIRVGQVLRLAAPGEPALLAQDGATGVTVTPLRAPPPVVDARSGGVAGRVSPGAASRSTWPTRMTLTFSMLFHAASSR